MPPEPKLPGIQWNKVTWYSQVIAIVLFVGVFALGFYLGTQYQVEKNLQAVAPVAIFATSSQNFSNSNGSTTDNALSVPDNIEWKLYNLGRGDSSSTRSISVPTNWHLRSINEEIQKTHDRIVYFFASPDSSVTFANWDGGYGLDPNGGYHKSTSTKIINDKSFLIDYLYNGRSILFQISTSYDGIPLRLSGGKLETKISADLEEKFYEILGTFQ